MLYIIALVIPGHVEAGVKGFMPKASTTFLNRFFTLSIKKSYQKITKICGSYLNITYLCTQKVKQTRRHKSGGTELKPYPTMISTAKVGVLIQTANFSANKK
jgi:hypothetical protein